jgi:hypothetical protein
MTVGDDVLTFIAKPPHAGSILLRRLLHRNVAATVRELPEPIRALVMMPTVQSYRMSQDTNFRVSSYLFESRYLAGLTGLM